MHVMETEAVADVGLERAQAGNGLREAGRNGRVAGWIATGAIAASMTASGILFVIGPAPVASGIAHLGYPAYFRVLLGIAKLLGVGALLAPRARPLREWAYAGFAFLFIAAILSHVLSGDGVVRALPATVNLGILFTSYVLRHRVAFTREFSAPEPERAPGRFWRAAPWFSRAALVPPALIFALVGTRHLASPVAEAAAVGTILSTPEAVTVSRVAAGVFPLSVALFLAAAVLSRRLLLAGLGLATTFIALATLVRLFGIVVEGATGQSMRLLHAELVVLTVCIAGFALEWSRRRWAPA